MCILVNRFDLKEIGQKYVDVDVNEDLELIEVIVKMDFDDKCYPKIEETIKELNELFGVDDFNIDDKFRYNIYSFRSEKLWYYTVYQF